MSTDDLILLPRSVVAALVDPNTMPYMQRTPYGEIYNKACVYCEADNEPFKGEFDCRHTADCPVRVVQERLKENR